MSLNIIDWRLYTFGVFITGSQEGINSIIRGGLAHHFQESFHKLYIYIHLDQHRKTSRYSHVRMSVYFCSASSKKYYKKGSCKTIFMDNL